LGLPTQRNGSSTRSGCAYCRVAQAAIRKAGPRLRLSQHLTDPSCLPLFSFQGAEVKGKKLAPCSGAGRSHLKVLPGHCPELDNSTTLSNVSRKRAGQRRATSGQPRLRHPPNGGRLKTGPGGS